MADVIEIEVWNSQNGCATFGLFCAHLTDVNILLSDRANAAFEWAVENRTGPLYFGGTNEAGFLYLTFRSERDAVLFKTFWL